MQRAKKEYNMVLLHPDNGSVESWTEEGSGDKMRTDFADFEPRSVVPTAKTYLPVILTCGTVFQRSKALELRQVDTQVAPHGPCPPSDLGASERPINALGRFVPPNACALSSLRNSNLA